MRLFMVKTFLRTIIIAQFILMFLFVQMLDGNLCFTLNPVLLYYIISTYLILIKSSHVHLPFKDPLNSLVLTKDILIKKTYLHFVSN